MRVDQITLVHSLPESILDSVLKEGLRAKSAFDTLGLQMREDVVYCWLCREDDKMWGKRPSYVYMEITVDRSRCRVAEMDFASIAMMYQHGQGGKSQNKEVASLLARAYELTSMPLADYHQGIFWTPEVLVKGDIVPDQIKIVRADEHDEETEHGADTTASSR